MAGFLTLATLELLCFTGRYVLSMVPVKILKFEPIINYVSVLNVRKINKHQLCGKFKLSIIPITSNYMYIRKVHLKTKNIFLAIIYTNDNNYSQRSVH